ncbi:hypothetical protein ACFQX4_03255 [Roseomonas sp. GCM10028921]
MGGLVDAVPDGRPGSAGRSLIPVYGPDLSGNERAYVLDCVDSSWISSIGACIGRF